MSWLSTAQLPRPHDKERLAVAWTRWSEKAARPDDAMGVALLEALFGNSPYLAETALQNPTFMTDLWRDGPDAVVTRLVAALAEARGAARDGARPDAVAATLRRLKRQQALAIAVADIAGVWPLEKITGELSAFADGCLDALTDAILLQLERDGQLAIGGNPEAAAFTVLGMGKLGADELNYSSDIDLILLYDRDAPALGDGDQVPRHFVRAARLLVQLMSESSVDGYIFRTDLRLRPDPGSTPLAMSVQAAELYYESVGQNWERAAMIKAHPVAGNRAVGAAFLAELTPYIWRRHLDFAAIHDIHSIKRQIDAYRGGGTVGVLGHNVKLGRGGIREIEFFAQTQQLIFGGRNPSLRQNETTGMASPFALPLVILPSIAAAAEIGTAFTYQGQLENPPGTPVDGVSCDFRFGLWDAATDGNQTAIPPKSSLSTLKPACSRQLELDSARLPSTARRDGWKLKFNVRATLDLTPPPLLCVELKPRRMHWLCPAFTPRNFALPNIIAGYHGNVMAPGVRAGTISGGGTAGSNANAVYDDYGTVGGGTGNRAGSDDSDNTSAAVATVSGAGTKPAAGFLPSGVEDLMSPTDRTLFIGGGGSNVASGPRSAIAGGVFNAALTDGSAIGGSGQFRL